MTVQIGALTLANPVMPASGTFAEGLAGVVDYNRLGAMVTKTITAELRSGNPVPRVAELGNGMLNSIGIPSKGIDHFLAETLPFYRRYESPLVVSISAPTVEDFAKAAAQLDQPGIAAIEANISCPNIEEDGRAFAMAPGSTGGSAGATSGAGSPSCANKGEATGPAQHSAKANNTIQRGRCIREFRLALRRYP